MSYQRKNYLSWDQYFMSVASLASLRTKGEPRGVCLVDDEHRILSVGYEEVPYPIRDGSEASLEFAVSPLSNALYTFRGRRKEFENGTLYMTYFPDYDESRAIAQARIHKVVYLTSPLDSVVEEISRLILESAQVEVEPYYDELYSVKEYKAFLTAFRSVIKSHIGKEESSYLKMDEYFMQIAVLSALRSKDPSTQVGACLVDSQKRILSIGYNGAPYGMSDDILPWGSFGERVDDLKTTKDPYIVHAEINAFDNYRGNQDDLKGSQIYLLYSPCEKCSKRMSIAGLQKIIYLREYTKNGVSKMSHRWHQRAGTICSPYNDEEEYSKEMCLKLLKDTDHVIQKNLVYR